VDVKDKFDSENLNEKDHLKDLGIDGRIVVNISYVKNVRS
jgi:hypothetical protein